jgi:hypothetical protein
MNNPIDKVPSLQAAREKIEQDILEAAGRVAKERESQLSGQSRSLAASAIALEHATLRAALEKDMPTKSVAQLLEKSSPSQVAEFIKAGKRSIEQQYGMDASLMVAALSAQVANVNLPKGLAQTDSMRDLVERGRNLVSAAVQEQYAERGKFTAGSFGRGSERHNNMNLLSADGVLAIKDQLKSHMTFVEAAVNYAVSAKKLEPQEGADLKARLEHQIFNVPKETKVSDQFKGYYEQAARNMRTEVMTDVRKVTQSKTVSEIAERLATARQAVEKIKQARGIER